MNTEKQPAAEQEQNERRTIEDLFNLVFGETSEEEKAAPEQSGGSNLLLADAP